MGIKKCDSRMGGKDRSSKGGKHTPGFPSALQRYADSLPSGFAERIGRELEASSQHLVMERRKLVLYMTVL